MVVESSSLVKLLTVVDVLADSFLMEVFSCVLWGMMLMRLGLCEGCRTPNPVSVFGWFPFWRWSDGSTAYISGKKKNCKG